MHPLLFVLYRRWRVVAAAAALLLLAGWYVTRPSEVAVAAPHAVDVERLQIRLPDGVVAADADWVVAVEGVEPGVTVSIVLDGIYGLRQYDQTPSGDVAEFSIAPADRPESGQVTLTALQGLAVATSEVEITPLGAVDPLDLYLGPRTVVADGVDYTMIVAVPVDRLGNPVIDGTPVDYLVTRPDLSTEQRTRSTDDLLSWEIVVARTVTGRTRLGVAVEGAQGPERNFLEVAGIPEVFVLELVDPVIPADGHALMRVRTRSLVDVYGNALPDGTAVILDLNGATGTRRLRSASIDGTAEFVFEVPDRPGTTELTAVASGTASVPLTVEFPAAVTDLPLEILEHADGDQIVIGPVITTRGAFVPDGTVATVRTNGTEQAAEFEQGVASVLLADGVLGDGVLGDGVLGDGVSGERLEIEVLGVIRSVEVVR